jgi:hypothetical protein
MKRNKTSYTIVTLITGCIWLFAWLIPTLWASAATPYTAQGNLVVQIKGGNVPAYTNELLAERLGKLTGREVQFHPTDTRNEPFIHLMIDESLQNVTGEEGYRIITTPENVTITSAGGNGLLYAVARFIEWVMAETTVGLVDKQNVDLDLPVTTGQAVDFFKNLPEKTIQEKPFYSLRGVELANLSLGVADLIDTPKIPEKYNPYSGVEGGFKTSAAVWKNWCDWLARHRMNFITNWPYSAGTNWWELANHPDTANMSIYSKEEIARAAEVREELFAYAHSRGLATYLQNYVPGAPSDSIKKSHPEIVREKFNAAYPQPFNLSNPKTFQLFKKQVQAIFHTYPSLDGLHLRFWGESFISPKDGPQKMHDLTVHMMESAKQVNPGALFIMSGFRHSGGKPKLAARFPENTVLQMKWGSDWEPIDNPGVPFQDILAFQLPVMISQNLPGEEYHSIGGVQYESLDVGVKKYAQAAEQVPNLVGFATVSGEKDHIWITETNYIVMARLNWSPLETDTSALIKNYLAAHYGPEVADSAYQAMTLSQQAMEKYVLGFAGICPYVNCFRTHNMFGLSRIKNLSLAEIHKGHAEINKYATQLAQAVDLLEKVQDKVTNTGQESFDDLLIQTRWFADFFGSRQLLAEAFVDQHQRQIDQMADKLHRLKEIDRHLAELGMSKPNISDDFEMEGMTAAINLRDFVNRELKEIDRMLDPQNLEYLRNSLVIVGQPSMLEIRGKVGNKQSISFNLPPDVENYQDAFLRINIWDLDGEKQGDEGLLILQNREIPLPPTGDSQARKLEYKVNMKKLQPNQLKVDFVLAGKPSGTSGYDIRSCKLVLLKR